MLRSGIDPEQAAPPRNGERLRNGERVRSRPQAAARRPAWARAEGARREADGSRRRRIWLAAGAAVVIVALVVAVVAVAAAANLNSGGVPAGTMLFAENDHSHVSGTVTYDRVPPAGGPHNPVQLNCGVYSQAVPNENAVHSLEHGAVWITYQPNLDATEVFQLSQVALSNYVGQEKYIIVSPYAGIPAPIVASAWGAQLYLNSPSDPRLLQFIHHFAGGGQGGEPGGPCSGGVGIPIE